MRKGLSLAEIDALEAEQARQKELEKEAKRVAAQQKRKKEAQLRAAAKKVTQEVAKKPDPKPEPQVTAPRTTSPALQQAVDEAFSLPYEPPSYHFGPNDDPYAELAQRELCRRKLLPFIQRFRPKYMAGWVHEDICRRIERFVKQVEQGLSPRLLLMMPPRSGKLLADNTRVPTPRGWVTHGELTVGDEVFHPSGRPVSVVAVSAKQLADVRVTFSDGSTYLCHENHEWTLFDRKRGEWKTLEAGHFLRPSHLGAPPKLLCGTRSMYQLPVVEALDYRDTAYVMHPYVLGAWLGDGSAGKPCITGDRNDRAITDKIQALGYQVSTVCEHTTTGVLTTYFSGNGVDDVGLVPKRRGPVPGRMAQELEFLGVYKQKRIPTEYQRLTTKLRLELLAGLLDTDGATDAQSRVSITTVSRELADDIMELATGLGFRPYMREVQPTLSSSGIQGRRVCYVVGFQPTMSIPVALERKRVKRFAKQRRVGLLSVERVPLGAAQVGHCVQVDSSDGLYVVGDKLTATHNSEISSRHTPAWILGQHPDWEIIAGSHTSSLSLSFSRYLRDVMRDPAYTAVFPDAVLDPSSQSVENWNLTKGGGYLAAGVGTGITGRGAHVLLLDDLVKDIEAADSLTIRDNTWEWYLSTAYTRIAPGGGVLGLMTWWHDDDWAGRIQQAMLSEDGDQFEIIKYPAINDYGDEYILPDDTIVQFQPDTPPPDGSRLTRPRNTAIHPARYTTEMMLKIKRNLIAGGQKRVWDALYQQNPIPDEGNYFSKEMFRYYGTAPRREDLYVYQAWDFAISEGKDSDYTVGTCIGVDHRDNVYYLGQKRFRIQDGGFIIDAILDFAQEHNADCLGFEDGQIWKAIEFQFQKRCEERKQFPSHELLKPLTDKMVRANPLRGRMQLGKVYFDKNAPYFTELMKEMLHFPAGKHDDQIDSLAWAVRLTLSRAAPREQRVTPKLKSWKDRLSGGARGGSHMAA